MTVHAARALGFSDRGVLGVGMRADFAVWDLDHPAELAYWIGHQACRKTILGGVVQ
jgi:imidazolonepropionase